MLSAKDVAKELLRYSNKEKIPTFARFFKTQKGDYSEKDIFIGVNLPTQRTIARKFSDKLTLTELSKLLKSPVHENRHTALIMLNTVYKKSPVKEQKKIVNFYLKHRKYINNWDLVDGSAPYVLGKYLLDKPKDILTKLAKSKSVWDRRIALVATWFFIRNNQFDETLKLVKLVLKDEQDLIHKAAGWMLKEISKRDSKPVEKFLDKYASVMPRTMLRYSVEKLPAEKKKFYMKK